MESIMACVDFSDVTETVVHTASTFAAALGAKLYLVHVVPIEPPVALEGSMTTVQDIEEDIRRAKTRMAELAAHVGDGLEPVTVVCEGDSVAEILEEAQRVHADLVVMGSHGHGALYHLLMGGTSQGVMKKARCPVLVVPSRKPAAAKDKREAA